MTDVVNNIYRSPSAARAVIHSDVIVFFIPIEEFEVEKPGYRLTAFGHDGSYAPEQSSEDVIGANPTEPLCLIHEERISIE